MRNMTTITPSRASSPMLCAIPWASGFILSQGNLKEIFAQNHYIQELLSCIRYFEDVTLTEPTQDSEALRDLLLRTTSPILSSQIKSEAQRFTTIFGYICALRLVDVILLVEKHTFPGEAPRYARQRNVKHLSERPYEELHDWVGLIKNCRNLFKDAQASAGARDIKDPIAHIISSIASRRKSIGRSKGNLDFAKTFAYFHGEENIGDACSRGSKDWRKLVKDQSDLDFLEGFFTSNAHKHKMALHLALLLTPLILLSSIISMFTVNWGRYRVLLMAKSLGNQKPANLVQVEIKMWQVMISIALGKLDTESGVLEILELCDEEFLTSISADERRWFLPNPIIDGVEDTISLHSPMFDGTTPHYISAFQSVKHPLPANLPFTLNAGQGAALVASSETVPNGEKGFSQGQIVASHQSPSQCQISTSVGLPAEQDGFPSIRSLNAIASVTTGAEETTRHLRPRPVISNIDSGKSTMSAYNVSGQKKSLRKLRGNREKTNELRDVSTTLNNDQSFYFGTLSRFPSESDIYDFGGRSESKSVFFEVDEESMRRIAHALEKKPLVNIRTRERIKLHKCPEIKIYDARNNMIEAQPTFGTINNRDRFQALIKTLESFYCQGRPIYLSKEEDSVFLALSESKYNSLSPREVQKGLRYRHIVIYDDKPCPLSFKDALGTLGLAHSIIDMQDQTSQDFGAHAVTGKGTLSQMLPMPSANQLDSRILISGRVPMGLAGVDQEPFSSDLYAWHYSKDLPFCKDTTEQYPAQDMIWGKAGKKNSLQCLATEPHGLCVCLEVKSGRVFLVAARPRDNIYDWSQFSKPDIFIRGLTCTTLDNTKCSMEGMVLESGTRILIRPNSPYLIFVLEDAVWHCQNFYSLDIFQESSIGIYHTLQNGDEISHQMQKGIASILRRMLFFLHESLVVEEAQKIDEYHPDFTDTYSTLSFFSFYTCIILINAMDHRTYQPLFPSCDINAILLEERLANMYTRGKNIQLIRWFFECYELINSVTGTSMSVADANCPEFILQYHAQLQSTLFLYKQDCERHKIPGVAGCSAKSLYTQIDRAFKIDPWDRYDISIFRATNEPQMFDSLAWKPELMQSLEVRKYNDSKLVLKEINFLRVGATSLDERYMSAFKLQLHDSALDWLSEIDKSPKSHSVLRSKRDLGKVPGDDDEVPQLKRAKTN